jgi:hypothetical protein
VVGGLHHGKTTLLDMLVEQTHDVAALGIRSANGKPLRFTDTRVDEQVRQAATPTYVSCCWLEYASASAGCPHGTQHEQRSRPCSTWCLAYSNSCAYGVGVTTQLLSMHVALQGC